MASGGGRKEEDWVLYLYLFLFTLHWWIERGKRGGSINQLSELQDCETDTEKAAYLGLKRLVSGGVWASSDALSSFYIFLEEIPEMSVVLSVPFFLAAADLSFLGG